MNMKKVWIVGIAILVFGSILIQPAIAQKKYRDLESELSVIGVIRIDSEKFEIKGFVLTGTNDGEKLLFQKVNIYYDETPILVTNPLPLVFNIKYNAA